MSTGSDLESMILSAAHVYQAQDMAELAKQHTPRLHGGRYRAKAPIDFKGSWRTPSGAWMRLYVEAKATSDGHIGFVVKGDGITEKQLDAMRDAVKRNVDMLLLVWFVPQNEIYSIDAKEVVSFANAAWRKSLTLYWCRAHGFLIRSDGKKAWFLGRESHPLRATAQEAIIAERAKVGGRIVELFPAVIEKPQTRLPPMTADERRQRIINATESYYRKNAKKGWR